MTKMIEVDDVRLKSLSVELRVMTVNGRQMTQSVFRQLPKASPFGEGGKIRGIPWGRVLYFWGDDKDCDGFQVVWECDGVLYRDAVWSPKHYTFGYKAKVLDDAENELISLAMKIDKTPYEVFRYRAATIIDENCAYNQLSDSCRALGGDAKSICREIGKQREQAEKDSKELYRKAFAELESLPQLFIAI